MLWELEDNGCEMSKKANFQKNKKKHFYLDQIQDRSPIYLVIFYYSVF